MKRDLELLRKLMFKLEESCEAGKHQIENYSFDSSEEMVKFEHIKLLIDEDFLDCNVTEYKDGNGMVLFKRITNKGHDFIDSIRSDTVWGKVKGKLAKVGSWTISIATELAKDEIKKQIGSM